jgi:hypothetical protein
LQPQRNTFPQHPSLRCPTDWSLAAPGFRLLSDFYHMQLEERHCPNARNSWKSDRLCAFSRWNPSHRTRIAALRLPPGLSCFQAMELHGLVNDRVPCDGPARGGPPAGAGLCETAVDRGLEEKKRDARSSRSPSFASMTRHAVCVHVLLCPTILQTKQIIHYPFHQKSHRVYQPHCAYSRPVRWSPAYKGLNPFTWKSRIVWLELTGDCIYGQGRAVLYRVAGDI